MQREYDLEEHLTRDELLALRNKRAGVFVFQVSWIMAFVCLVVVNWQLRFSPNWMPPGTEPVSAVPGAVATIGLLLSAGLVKRAVDAVRADDQRAFLMQWLGAMGLGVLFVGIMLVEWFSVEPGTQYALVFRFMTGFHVFHALAIGVYMLLVYNNGRRGAYGPYEFWAVEAGARLWYFVLVAWLLFYVVIYWA